MNHKFRNRRFLFLIPIIILFALTGVVMLLWNCILPDVLGVAAISYWQAMGILVLSKILFGGFHGFKKHKEDFRKRQLFNKMKNMTPEEREKFREMWKERFDKKGFCNH